MEILQVLLTSLSSLVALFILTKVMGNKQVSQLTMFDYIVGITIGSIAAEMATELEKPLNSLTAMVIYAVVAYLVSKASEKWLNARKLLTGQPRVMMDNGKLYRENMKKSNMELSEFLMQCRNQGYFDINQIQTAVLENNGALSILPVSKERPLTPNDMNLNPQQDYMQTPIILDGHVNHENLKSIGKNDVWLNKQLSEQRYKSEEVFLALCDNGNNVSFFPIHN